MIAARSASPCGRVTPGRMRPMTRSQWEPRFWTMSIDVEIGIRSLFEAPTVEALGKRLVHGRPALSDFDVVLPIRPSGTKLPLFCIHDAGGFSWPYSKLIRHIPSDHPIYGLQARNLTQRIARAEQDFYNKLRAWSGLKCQLEINEQARRKED